MRQRVQLYAITLKPIYIQLAELGLALAGQLSATFAGCIKQGIKIRTDSSVETVV